MSSLFIWKQLRRHLVTRNRAEDSRLIAEKAAHRSLDYVLEILAGGCAAWSDSQLRGYLRATAAPRIDLELAALLPYHLRTGGFGSQVRSTSLDILQELVIQKLKNRQASHSAETAAA